MSMFKVAFSLISYKDVSACSTLDWVLNSQPDFDWVIVYASLGISNTIEDNSNANMPYYVGHPTLE